VGGNYNDLFFLDAKTESGYQQRIRAVVQDLNEERLNRILRSVSPSNLFF
jgi:hypothetical protein